MSTGNFAIFYRPTRERLVETITEQEIATVQRHYDYLRRALAAGRLFLAGRCEDASLNLAVINAASEEEARAFIDGDPCVRDGLFRADLKPWRTVFTQLAA
ncbi:MAG TPA: YciI family protein [Longimicrobium sp.]|jgi:uncharacterized protein YciI